MAVILDTVVLLWMSQGSPRLGRGTALAIEQASRDGSLRFSAISMLEVSRLHWDESIDLKVAPDVWLRGLHDVGVHEIPVTAEIASLAGSLKIRHSFHSDPADQLITATAMVTRSKLITSDRKILGWATSRKDIQCLDARA